MFGQPRSAFACIAEWREVPAPRGIFLLVHGLNNAPTVMRPFGDLLNQLGYTTAIVALTGHRAEERIPSVSRERWRSDIACAAREAGEREPKLPVSALGFSLGGALALEAMRDLPQSPFERLVLVAPALGLKGYTVLMRFAAWFDWTGLAVPSFIPEAYRSGAFTPLTGYGALFEVVDGLLTRPPRAPIQTTPTLVFLNAGDEFISVSRTQRFVRDESISTWRIVVLPEEDLATPTHLMLDSATFGGENWARVTREITDFLGGS